MQICQICRKDKKCKQNIFGDPADMQLKKEIKHGRREIQLPDSKVYKAGWLPRDGLSITDMFTSLF